VTKLSSVQWISPIAPIPCGATDYGLVVFHFTNRLDLSAIYLGYQLHLPSFFLAVPNH